MEVAVRILERIFVLARGARWNFSGVDSGKRQGGFTRHP